MKNYRGFVGLELAPLVVVDYVRNNSENASCLRDRLNPRYDVINHSPDGFNWGYNGSGPHQLAFALLADCCGVTVAFQHYQEFSEEVVASLEQHADFQMTEQAIKSWAATALRQRITGG